MKPCRWWQRWLHQRLRRIDRAVMLPEILERTTSPHKRCAAWLLFMAQPGQEHWHCACASADCVGNFWKNFPFWKNL